jgi:hypothetical protein
MKLSTVVERCLTHDPMSNVMELSSVSWDFPEECSRLSVKHRLSLICMTIALSYSCRKLNNIHTQLLDIYNYTATARENYNYANF